MSRLLVHLASGVGNIVLATPLLQVLARAGHEVDLLVDGDYGDTAGLFAAWGSLRAVHTGGLSALLRSGGYDRVIPAVPPFYWPRYARLYAHQRNLVPRPPNTAFYADEQAYYLSFARSLDCAVEAAPSCFLPVAPDTRQGIGPHTVVLAPGCKTGEMAAKRWPYFPELAQRFAHVAVVGTPDDLFRHDGSAMHFPDHARTFIGQRSLTETAALLAAAGTVVANDSGLGHIAAAVGVPTLLLFGPTPHVTLGAMADNVTVLRAGLSCEPCWFRSRLAACRQRVDCLHHLSVDTVAAAVTALLEGA